MGSATSSEPGPGSTPPRMSPVAGLRRAVEGALPKERFGDHLTLLSGTGQNLLGLAVYVVASFGTNVLIARAFRGQGAAALGIITLATQLAFVIGAGTRFGMDMAAVRLVAIDMGKGEPGRIRPIVRRAVLIASVFSVAVAVALYFGAGGLAHVFTSSGAPLSEYRTALEAAAVALPFVAVSQVYLGGTRGLKMMRQTLYVQWVGQPVAWIVLMVAGWVVSKTAGMSVLAYAVSWAFATLLAWPLWLRASAGHAGKPLERGETAALLRYGAPRAPAALLSQLLFWTDYFVVSGAVSATALGVYAAAVRVSQALGLFLIAVNYMFSPFVADLHARGELDRLDGLYKALTRWMLAGTLPILLLLAIVPGPVLQIFGSGFGQGTLQLRILLIGQIVNVGVGSVGFILIMVGRTGWDLAVYVLSFAIDLAVALTLRYPLGTTGAAIAQASALVTANLLRLWLVWRFVHIQPFTRHYFRLLIPAAIGGAAMLAVHLALKDGAWPVDLVVSAAVGWAVYAVALLGLGLTPTERGAVRKLLGRAAA